MKKIGFIDRHLNNFHANTYIKLIREGAFKDRFDVAYAYGETGHNGVSNEEWCEDHQVTLLDSPRAVVEKSDALIVLAPDNAERHWDLSQEALRSSKRVYIDKTFTTDFKTAVEMIRLAQTHGTPMFTSSALRFVPDLAEYQKAIGTDHPTRAVMVQGPSDFKIYGIHLIEPLVMLLGHGAQAIHFFGDAKYMLFTIRYPDGRMGTVNQFESACSIGGRDCSHPYQASVLFDTGAVALHFNRVHVFRDMVDTICRFFEGGDAPVPYEDTLEVMALIDAGQRAMSHPGAWVDVPRAISPFLPGDGSRQFESGMNETRNRQWSAKK